MMKKILVAATGLTGLIGSRLVELMSRDFEWLALKYEDGFDITSGKKISMFEDTVFTPTFIDDIAPALAAILARKPTGIFHVVGSTSLSPYDAAMEVTKVFGLNEKLVWSQKLNEYLRLGGRPYPRYAGLSNEKLKQELGVSMWTFSDALWEMKKQLAS